MKAKNLIIGAATALAFGASPAFADHNSVNGQGLADGEGWANMPNDIHNTRVETLNSDDNEAFRDFVKYGEGSESINRFDSDDTTAKRAKAQTGASNTEQTQTQMMQGARNNTRTTEQKRERSDRASSASARQRTALQRDRAQRPERQSQNRQRSGGRRK